MSPRSRRELLAAGIACLVLFTGCSEAPSGDAEPSAGDSSNGAPVTATETRTERSRTATQTTPVPKPELDCEAASRPDPAVDDADDVEPVPYPDAPTFPVETEWVVEHERAYLVNRAIAEYDLADWHGTMIEETRRESFSHGVVVRVAYTYGMQTSEWIADSPIETAAYYVNDRGALRAHSRAGGGPASDLDPIVEDVPVVCF
ncbi:hypothetical protein NDI76_04760 [Halogeometricum sp. S1BR25-6]|uniref:Lipoprotein n=1 Tax=Halogeometricum salsisoli TaxID=2950536 RepID=A0ABU2GB79_9EURY|nr:hypothetical protein [Halogeometricum sp. S1BR25-6]MDS0298045.1 hypothetical protein [Halogeometricum sp. S1BR25-6]